MAFNLGRFMKKSPILSTGLGMLGGGGIGSILGLLLGGGGSGGSGGLSGLLGGSPGQEIKTPHFTPEQEEVLNQLLQQGSENMDLSGVEDLAMKRFQEDVIPSLAERFTSMGAGGQRSSAFQSALGRAGSDVSTQLAALRPQYGMQQLQMGLQPRFGTSFQEGRPGLGQTLSKSLPSLLGKLGGFL